MPRTGEDLVTSSKINHLLEDLLAFSRLNRHSKNFAGDRSGMAGVSKDCFLQEQDDDDDMADMLVMGGGGAPEDVIKPEPGQDLVTDSPAALNDSSTILHGNAPTTAKAEPQAATTGDAAMATDDAGPSAAASTSAPAAEQQAKPAAPAADSLPDSANDFSFDNAAHNKAIIIKDVANRQPLGEPWASDMATGKPIKSIVFSQWTTMLDRIEDAIVDSGIGYDRLDGSMKLDERVRAMDRLKTDPACEVLLVSLRAGGVGLNLTSASRVYVMDPYWNPAVENQAVDRVHRLGQTRPVVTIKYISASLSLPFSPPGCVRERRTDLLLCSGSPPAPVHDSMEEKMLDVQARKTKVAGLTLAQNISRKELHEQRMEDLKVRPCARARPLARSKADPFLAPPDPLLVIAAGPPPPPTPFPRSTPLARPSMARRRGLDVAHRFRASPSRQSRPYTNLPSPPPLLTPKSPS